MENPTEIKIEIPQSADLRHLYGQKDFVLRFMEDVFNVRIVARGHSLKIIGEEDVLKQAREVIDDLIFVLQKKGKISQTDLETMVRIARTNEKGSGITERKNLPGTLLLQANKGLIRPKTEGQKQFIEKLNSNDILFAIGPAGTGKTYLAVAMAVACLKEEKVKKIILARPAVEAGESLGFLPGDFKEKIDPYLKPLYDALEDMLPRDVLRKYLDQQIIEILPLAYMRGRTLNNAFVILDEAQNSTFTQMKMFLTRLGFNSKAIITGDITQIDLPSKKQSGLIGSIRVLEGIRGIAFIYLGKEDVVRHYLVKEIIDAYEKYDEQNSN